MRIDIHQHIWTRPLLDRLAARGTMPLVRASDGVTVLHSAAEQPYVIDISAEMPGRRATLVHDYVAQMQAAWLTFASFGRREHPELVVVFAMLAGLAPLLSERLTARGGPTVDLRDPLTFYETSSYGSAAVDAIVRQVGEAQLAYGSDRPVIEPIATGREAVLQTNGAGLIAPIGVLPYEAVGRRARSAD